MAKLKVSLAMMTMNEIEGVRKIVPRISRKGLCEFFCIDNNSADGTVEYLKKQGIRVIRQTNKGRGNAERMCIDKAKGDAVIWFSPDGNEVPEDIPKLIKKIEDGYDMVIASRFYPGAKSEDVGIIHGFGNQFLIWLANLLFGMRLYDSINGFRIIKKEPFYAIGSSAFRHEGGLETSIRMAKKGFKIGEIPSDEPLRIGGKSKIKTVKDGWIFLTLILKEFFIRKIY